MRKRSVAAGFLLAGFMIGIQAPSRGAVLADNGPLETQPGFSVSQNLTLGMSVMGFGANGGLGSRVADDFTVPTNVQWEIAKVTLFAYQTGSGTDSTITGATLRIWDGPPGDVGSTVIHGDDTANILSATSFSGIYRVNETSPEDTNRPIMRVEVETVGLTLSAGTYWLDWNFTGSLASGPFQPLVTILGQTTTGNARMASADSWEDANDTGTNTPQGLPFIIEGVSIEPPPLPRVAHRGAVVRGAIP